jgi:peptidoglycan/LPS O-acetylase OafA/YrhL
VTAGIPGLGLSGLFMLASALMLPFLRRRNRRASRRRSAGGRLVAMAVAMGALVSGVWVFVGAPRSGPPLVLVSLAILGAILAVAELALHLIGAEPTPTPPPVIRHPSAPGRTVAEPAMAEV